MNSPDGVIFMVIVAMMDFCYDRSNDVRFVRRAAYLKNRQIFRMKLLTLTSAIILLTPGIDLVGLWTLDRLFLMLIVGVM
ncbi:hypothetical protein [Arthrospira platensis]|uniref:hypothetical protein n=1 Tax=Limnospira platensis TaxID=118562 RepID=UPI000A4BC991